VPALNLDEIIKCLGRIAEILHDRPEDALKELRSISARVDSQIPYRDGHILRVTDYSVAIGNQLGLDENVMLILETAALLHDYGKIGIDEAILAKPDKLTPAERKEIEMHTMRGYYILSGFPEFGDALMGVKSHHEKYDGSGYPEGLSGEHIPLIARVLAVADSYDAMTSARPYRRAKTKGEAIIELKRCSGTEFDPEIVNAFLEILKSGGNTQQ
jgi:HD-GYP domain-containing protein (c-di-GMP phosphodiesterase class II)